MSFRSAVILSGFFFIACKTMPRAPLVEPVAPAPAAASPAAEVPPLVIPSPALQTTPHLVTPGPDEALIRRGAGSRCPNSVEWDEVEQAVQSLGRDTISLVKEDLISIRQTSSRSDRDSINSCCNQLEQLVQDVEIMNEDKESATSAIDRIRRMTLQLCPGA